MRDIVEYAELTLGAADGANEDAVAHWRYGDDLVLAMADGVGDRSAGHVASAMASRRSGASSARRRPTGRSRNASGVPFRFAIRNPAYFPEARLNVSPAFSVRRRAR